MLEACFLSPRVNRLLLSDFMVESIRLDSDDDQDVFEDSLQIGRRQLEE